MKNKLAIIEKWRPEFHGVGCNEDIRYYFDIMENLNFITLLIEKKDIFKVIEKNNSILDKTLNPNCLFDRQLKVMVLRGGFTMRGRMFGIPNKSFLNFISKMKKRFKRKIDLKKSIKELRYRECHGKFRFR